ncbi:glycerophosphodiester phosphodiesterase family protein [Hyphococcus sp.]|uniref:glycerophosphodiester phosphodiesterase family protein n=1 Tax=Hyphococcus sp. TaxID=2038636 RepID=UPI0035C6EE29
MIGKRWMWLAPLLALAGCTTSDVTEAGRDDISPTLDGKPPLVIAHRGASGYLPEHTLKAYGLAIEQGADVIEPDLVFTKDGVLVARHDRYLSTTTDVAGRPEFADRKKPNADPNDAPRDDWWVEDFTLAELKTLRAVQPFPGRSKDYDGLYEIPTFKEVLAFVSVRADEAGRSVGVYPETKHPAYFQSIGMDFEQPLLTALDGFEAGPVFIQSFEPDILKRLNGKTDAKLVQLIYEEMPGTGPNIPLAEIAKYADGIGAEKFLVNGMSGMEGFGLPHKAEQLGLFVHLWTFRNDVPNERFITLGREGKIGTSKDCEEWIAEPLECIEGGRLFTENELHAPETELGFYLATGAGGIFTDFPDTAVNFLSSYAGKYE